jgi:MOSC domain-containing protein YiiM
LIDTDVLLEVTQIGKECHNGGCVIQSLTGDCIMPKEGVFCKVLQGGRVTPDMRIERSGSEHIVEG